VKNKIMLVFVTLTLVIGLVVVGCAKPAPAPAPAPAPTPAPIPAPAPTPKPEAKTLTAVGFIPVDNISMDHMWKYKAAVEKYSGGQLIIDVKGAGEVIPPAEQIFAVKKGIVDMMFSMGDMISEGSPIGFAMTLTNMKPWEEREKGIWDFYRETLGRDANVYYLGQLMSPQWWILTGNVAAKSPDDLKGLKIRTGATLFGSVEAIGAVPVSTPHGDIYTSVERGVVDAFLFPPIGWLQWGWQEVTKYWVGPRLQIMQNSCPLINLDVWNSLSEEQQNWLTQPIIDNEEVWYGYNWWLFTGEPYGEEAILKAGLERIEWSEEDSKWMQDTFREALWDFVEGQVNPDDFAKFEKLVGGTR